MPRLGTREGFGRYYDFSRGVVGALSDASQRPRHLRLSNNLDGFPVRSMGSVRPGYVEAQTSAFEDEPTSIFKYVPDGYASRLIVCCKNDSSPGAGKIFTVTPGVTDKVQLSSPAGFTITDKEYSGTQLKRILYLAQRGDSQAPLMFQRYVANGNYTLDKMTLGVPSVASTATIGTSTPGVDVGYHWWRIRYLYRGGASKAATPFPTGGRDVTTGNRKVTIGTILDTAITTPAKQDYYAWVIERTKLSAVTAGHYTGTLGSTAMPDARAQWYFVAQGTASTYDDLFQDADLFDLVDDGIFETPPHMEGLISHKDRLIGWNGNIVYVSQAVGDEMGTGPCNWDPDNNMQIGPEDGDSIQAVVQQADRLLVCFTRSVYPIEGDGPDTFRTFAIQGAGGVANHRAIAAVGTEVYMFDGAGMSVVRGNRIDTFGSLEVSHYLDQANQGLASLATMFNLSGERLLLCYADQSESIPSNVIEYNFISRQFRHHSGLRIRHALLQAKNTTDFGGADMLFVDPVKFSPADPRIVFVNGLMLADPLAQYRIWSGFTGTLDAVLAGGGGGIPIAFNATTTWLDDGEPDSWKDISRVELEVEGFTADIGMVLTVDQGPEGGIKKVARTFPSLSTGSLWGDDLAGTGPYELVWADDEGTVGGSWATDPESNSHIAGIPMGSAGRRYSLEIYGEESNGGTLLGVTLDGVLLPDRRL